MKTAYGDIVVAIAAVAMTNTVHEPALVRDIPISLLLWTGLGTFLGAGASTLFANEQINNTMFYRRLVASIMGGMGMTPMLLLGAYSFIVLKIKNNVLAALVYDPASIIGIAFIISMLFWSVMTWHQRRNDAILDKLAGIPEEQEPRRTVVIVQTDNAAEILREVKDERL